MKLLLDRLSEHLKQKAEKRAFLESNRSARGFGGIIGRTPGMEKLYRIIAKAAQCSHPTEL